MCVTGNRVHVATPARSIGRLCKCGQIACVERRPEAPPRPQTRVSGGPRPEAARADRESHIAPTHRFHPRFAPPTSAEPAPIRGCTPASLGPRAAAPGPGRAASGASPARWGVPCAGVWELAGHHHRLS
ncbi:hypothetical protein FA95DRAFT_1557151 [Auriscalpium vulgare]|uniref:Uncharacterized protein n=1 Tax=Auriscalpium vulgare TaxID=40419 RepID=A0ACB8RZD9_9AGAM|nr:hypothetical protein FA95DRAFT_1557151 [Auriscalpium vulgare]